MNLLVSWQERIRSAIGAGLGIGMTGLTGWWLSGYWPEGLPWLVAPMGASALLVFTLSSSPLAQPWAVLAGNTLSALVGLLCAHYLGVSILGMALAVALAIVAMFATHSLHPPGAATALLMVLSPLLHPWGALALVFCNALVLVLVGMVYNRLTGKSYPHHADLVSQHTLRHELELVLKKHNEVVDISLDDLEVLIEEAVALKGESKSMASAGKL
jgi:CBS domain-containing membrane protein